MKYIELEKYLFEIRDDKFASFSKSLSSSDYQSIGVKNPTLRQIIKDHKNDLELNPDDFVLGNYLEVDFIYFGLSLIRCKDTESQLKFLRDKIHLAKSWAITDTMSTYIKKMNFEEYWKTFLYFYKSNHIYDRRMGYVLGLKFYKDSKILNILNYIHLNDEYMVMMSEAWLIATIAISFPEEIYHFLEKCKDITLRRKTICKINESYRINDTYKVKFKSLR